MVMGAEADRAAQTEGGTVPPGAQADDAVPQLKDPPGQRGGHRAARLNRRQQERRRHRLQLDWRHRPRRPGRHHVLQRADRALWRHN